MHRFRSGKFGGHSPHSYYSVIKRLSKQYVELFLVGVVVLSYKRFSCNWTGDQKMVLECVQHIDVYVKTHMTKTSSSSPLALLAHHTQTVLSYSGTSWIKIRVSTDWYLLFWEFIYPVRWNPASSRTSVGSISHHALVKVQLCNIKSCFLISVLQFVTDSCFVWM